MIYNLQYYAPFTCCQTYSKILENLGGTRLEPTTKLTYNKLTYFAGDLLAAIVRDYGSFANMKEQLTKASVAVQGSGWGWLVSFISNFYP